jgi:hypothetical protein
MENCININFVGGKSFYEQMPIILPILSNTNFHEIQVSLGQYVTNNKPCVKQWQDTELESRISNPKYPKLLNNLLIFPICSEQMFKVLEPKIANQATLVD